MHEATLIQRAISKVSGAEPREAKALVWGFGWFFFLLLGYYVLRPVRDAFGASGGIDRLKWLFTGTFAVMLCVAPLYSALVARVGRQRLVRISYRFFALNLVLFWLSLKTGGVFLDFAKGCYFIWVSVFNLFVVSIFWSCQAEIFSSAQGRRLFGFLAAGGTLGALCGGLITRELATLVGTGNLLLIPAALLEVCLFFFRRFNREAEELGVARSEGSELATEGTGGSIFEGVSATFRSPYLMTIACYTLCMALLGTSVYFRRAEVLSGVTSSDEQLTEFFSVLEIWTTIATFLIQAFLTARLLRWIGVAATLCILPVIYAAGWGALGVASTVGVIAVFDVARRAGAYAITSPARQVLFTSLTRTQKYKAKSFLDTAVFRGGDAAAAHAFGGPLMTVLVPLALVWAWIGHKTGRMHQAAAGSPAAPDATD